ncbi:hypothetical protein [Geobacter anodireducens]
MKKLIGLFIAWKLRHRIKDAGLRLLRFGLDTVDGLLGVQKVPLLSYGEAVKYFVTDRPADERIAKGALLNRKVADGFLVVWLFLDGADKPLADAQGKIYGRKFLVKALDEELAECFSNNEILVFE